MSSAAAFRETPPSDRLKASENLPMEAEGQEPIGHHDDHEMTIKAHHSSSSAPNGDECSEQQQQQLPDEEDGEAAEHGQSKETETMQPADDRHSSSSTSDPCSRSTNGDDVTTAAQMSDHQRSTDVATHQPIAVTPATQQRTSVGCIQGKMTREKEEDGPGRCGLTVAEDSSPPCIGGQEEGDARVARKPLLTLLPRIDQYERHPLLQKRTKTGITEFEMLMIERELIKRRQSMESNRASPSSTSSSAAAASATNRRRTGGSLRQQPTTTTPTTALIPRSAIYERHPLLKKSADGVFELERILQEKQQQQQQQKRQASSVETMHSTHPQPGTSTTSTSTSTPISTSAFHPSQATTAKRTDCSRSTLMSSNGRKCEEAKEEAEDEDPDEERDDPSADNDRFIQASAATDTLVSMETESQQQLKRVRFQKQESAHNDHDAGLAMRTLGGKGGGGSDAKEGNGKKEKIEEGIGKDGIGKEGSISSESGERDDFSSDAMIKTTGGGRSQTIAATSKENNSKQQRQQRNGDNHNSSSDERTDGRGCCLS